MSNTHTPGPWKISAESIDPEWVIITAAGGQIIANVNRASNAHLIAVAPDMVAILQQAIRASGFEISGPTDSRAAEDGEPVWVCNARGAIADALRACPTEPAGIVARDAALFVSPTDGNIYFLDGSGQLMACPQGANGVAYLSEAAEVLTNAEMPAEMVASIRATLEGRI